jgi:FixJ family two-component response regulator
MTSARVYVIDDDASTRTALTRQLAALGYEVQTYASAGEFLLHPPPDGPGCILLDVCMPGPSGLELQEALSHRPASLPIVFLSGQADIAMSVQAMKAGAVDFLIKPVERKALLEAITHAVAIGMRAQSERERLREAREHYAALTAREKEIFSLVVTGKLNKQIAFELGTAERTVKAHRAQLMDKMRAGSIAELCHFAEVLRSAS